MEGKVAGNDSLRGKCRINMDPELEPESQPEPEPERPEPQQETQMVGDPAVQIESLVPSCFLLRSAPALEEKARLFDFIMEKDGADWDSMKSCMNPTPKTLEFVSQPRRRLRLSTSAPTMKRPWSRW